MGKRLTKICTKTGDKGTTGLGDGSRLDKDHLRIEAIGVIDELNSLLGIFVSMLRESDDFYSVMLGIQNDLFDLGGELSVPGYSLINGEQIVELELKIEQFNKSLPPLKNFILPGGTTVAAYCQLSRSVCRRAERIVVSLSKTEKVNLQCQIYLNRLSDLLFIIGRTLARRNGGKEILWQQKETGR